MKKTVMAMALLGILILVALAGRVEGTDDHTYVNNLSSKPIRGTTSYNFPFATSQFINRLIAPNTYQFDVYSQAACQWSADYPDNVNVILWVDGAAYSNTAVVDCDSSVVGLDNADLSGVDIYVSVYGNINAPTGSVLFTIYP